ncbi:hypothetical protein RUM44_002898, partial [Polyplax serrata]
MVAIKLHCSSFTRGHMRVREEGNQGPMSVTQVHATSNSKTGTRPLTATVQDRYRRVLGHTVTLEMASCKRQGSELLRRPATTHISNLLDKNNNAASPI